MAGYNIGTDWLKQQLKRIERLNRGEIVIDENRDGIHPVDRPMTLSPEWNNEEEIKAQKDIRLPVICLFCKDGLTARHTINTNDKHIFEFTLGETLKERDIPTQKAKKFIHEWCFLDNVGKEFYAESKYKQSNSIDWQCGECLKHVDVFKKGAGVVTLRRCVILDRTSNGGSFQVQGHIHFCVSCFVNMAGENFFI